MNNLEYIIWGIPTNEKHEIVLFTKSISLGQAEKTCDYFERKNMATNCRIQILNNTEKPDFTKLLERIK